MPLTPLRAPTIALLLLASLPVMGFIITLDRAPRVWPDEVIYASVARSIEQRGSGVPTLLEDSSVAVDHERFYGPVFFRLAAASFSVLGFSITSFRIVALVGALIAGLAAMHMVRVLGGDRLQQLWAFALLMLTPELGSAATNGRMDSLAVGLGVTGLMLFVRALVRSSTRDAAAAGVGLALAALTTPRAFPFVAAFVLTGCGFAFWQIPRGRTTPSRLFAVAGLMLTLFVGAWATWTHGNPVSWVWEMANIAAHTPIEGGLAPDVPRDWEVAPWTVWTTVFSLIAAAIALPLLLRRVTNGDSVTEAARFALAVSVISTGLCFAVVNFTFAFSIYFAVPMLATVVAIPGTPLDVRRLPSLTAQPLAALLCATFLAGCGGVRLVKYAGVAATWSARRPAALRDFISRHVPPGSEVWGPRDFGIYAVEGSGSSYRSLEQESWADWARGAQPAAPAIATARGNSGRSRFILWPVEEEFPAVSSTCIPPSAEPAIAVFDPGGHHLDLLGPLAPLMGVPGYPRTALYRMPPDCR